MKTYKIFVFASSVVFLLAGYVLTSSPVNASTDPVVNSQQISLLLSDAKGEAIQLREDAERMGAFTRPPHLSLPSFTRKMEEIREHLNRTGKIVTAMQELRATGLPWQQQAIDHIIPPLNELANNVRSTIEYLNDHQDHLHTTEMIEYVRLNSELATDLAAVITEFNKYGETQAKLQDLEKRISAR